MTSVANLVDHGLTSDVCRDSKKTGNGVRVAAQMERQWVRDVDLSYTEGYRLTVERGGNSRGDPGSTRGRGAERAGTEAGYERAQMAGGSWNKSSFPPWICAAGRRNAASGARSSFLTYFCVVRVLRRGIWCIGNPGEQYESKGRGCTCAPSGRMGVSCLRRYLEE